MKIRSFIKSALTACTVLAVFGCGGDGGGGTSSTTPETPGAPTAVLKLSTQGTLPAGTLIGGVDVTMNLPEGVTARADSAGATEAGVVAASGDAQGGTAVAKYTDASGSTPGQVRAAVVKAQGFTTGEFVTINCDFTGTAPTAAGFTVAALSVTDVNGVAITGLSVTPAVQIQ